MAKLSLQALVAGAWWPLLACSAVSPTEAGAGGSGGAATGGTTVVPTSGSGGATPLGGSSSQMGGGGTAPAGGTPPGGGGATAGTGGSSGTAGSGGAAAGTAGSGGAGGGPPDCTNGKVVHFTYFVEADATFSESQRADIEEQAFAFQKYWFDQLGVTFYLSHPVVTVIDAEHDANWYLTNPDGIHGTDDRWYRLGNISNEVRDKLGIRNNPNRRIVSYPTSRHDGRVGANFGGAWMDGDDLTCLASGGFNYPYDDQNSAHCMGHVAHEFGHVLGLDHQGPQDDCMQFGFYTNDADDLCSFSADNVEQILQDPGNDGWFEAMPGETCVGG